MANTTRFNLEIPDVGADADAWGGILNNYFNALEAKIFDRVTGDTTPLVNGATTLRLQTGGVDRVTVDAAGNAGLGVVPSAWGAAQRALQIGSDVSLYRNNVNDASFTVNSFGNGTNSIYIANGFATNYRQNVGTHQWFIAPSGTAGAPITFSQAMTLDATGNLGVGTITPLDVLHIAKAGGTGDGARLRLQNTGTRQWTVGTNNESLTFRDETAATERARITSAGYFKASNTGTYSDAQGSNAIASPYHHMENNGDIVVLQLKSTNTGSSVRGIISAFVTGATGNHIDCRVNNVTNFQVLANGTIQSTNTTVQPISSDERVKTITDTLQDATDVINGLNPVKFDYTGHCSEWGTHYGFIAQQVGAVKPDALRDAQAPADCDITDMKTYDPEFLVPYLVRALQQSNARVAALTDRIAALEAK